MKLNLKKIGAIMAFCLLMLNVKADLILQDNFDSYGTGDITNNSGGFWSAHSGATPALVTNFPTVGNPSNKALQVSQNQTEDIHALFTGGITIDSSSPLGLYTSFTLMLTNLQNSATPTYFAHFYQNSTTFKARIFAMTNGVSAGNYRIGIVNGGTPAATNTVFPQDLIPGVSYTIVTRYFPGTGISTLWVNPTDTNSVNTIASDAASTGSIVGYAFRQNTGEGVLYIDNLLVGTNFSDVMASGPVGPTIATQPQDANVFVGNNATFTTLASGSAPITYQWFYNTNTLLVNATNATLTVSNVTTLSAGTYSAIASNSVSTATTRYAVLTVSSVPIPPTITNQPANTTVNAGDTATFTVLAGGSPTLAYQWSSVIGGVTNAIANATSATLSLSAVTVSANGKYFVTITNSFGSTNSTLATLTVNPPPTLSIGQLRSLVDTNFAPTNTTTAYTITGIVTTWTNMTTSTTSSEFYMQDNSGGIVVFWSGAAPGTNLPPAGSLVQVTGPLAAFNGLLEIEPVAANPVHGVTVLSTNNPLPKAQPLPFDPNVTGSLAAMKNFEGMYFVASNVMLNLVTPNFVSGANDTITNNAQNTLTATNSGTTLSFTNQQGQTFVLFINAGTDIPNKAKYTTPVTIFGVLGYFSSAGYEFTPSRFADIISYNHVTNVLVNARKGDLATNSYSELVVRPGESLTTAVSIGDVAGGNVTLTPTGTLPTGAVWSGITSGATATAVLNYTGSPADAGNNYPVQLAVSTTTGASYVQTVNVYVPTPDEQQIAITEFLANPTTNPSAAYYNPLARSSAVNGISTNDQYIEIANQSGSDLGFGFMVDTGTPSKPVFDSTLGFGTTISSLSSLVIYGGNGTNNLTPGLSTPTGVSSSGLFLPTTGSGILELRNPSGYIIDRVAYSASDLSTNGSLSRFPTINSAFVPQAYISTAHATPGGQYDGGSWANATKVPTGVTGIVITYVNGKAVLTFSANTTQASTLWNAGSVTGPFNVIGGQPFPGGAGAFTNVNSAAQQFYYITTQ